MWIVLSTASLIPADQTDESNFQVVGLVSHRKMSGKKRAQNRGVARGGTGAAPTPHSGWVQSWDLRKTVEYLLDRGVGSMMEENVSEVNIFDTTWLFYFARRDFFHSKISTCVLATPPV